MSKLNPNIKSQGVALAGGYGAKAAKQDAEATLRRLVLANLLWEDNAYVDGQSTAEAIAQVLPQVEPAVVANLVKECRFEQKLRHTPLYLIRLMAALPEHKGYVSTLLPQVCTRADMITDFLAIYWKDGKTPLSNQVKKGLAKAFERFDAYQLAKYDRNGAIRLRDALFLVHGRPPQGKEDLYKQLVDRTLEPSDTWEVALSTGQGKKESWERLIQEKKLGALAFLRNLSNFEKAGVEEAIVREGFQSLKSEYLLPINFLAAANAAPKWIREIESLMFRSFSEVQKLAGTTIFVVDVSGSMHKPISSKSEYARIDIATAMIMLAAEQCESIKVYATAGNDLTRMHSTEMIKPYRGFALSDAIWEAKKRLGGGGIFTRQCLEYIRSQERVNPDRIIVFSDSQDRDTLNSAKPQPFGRHNFIIDVSAHQHGINHKGVWTAEISGWSEHFLKYLAAYETSGINLN